MSSTKNFIYELSGLDHLANTIIFMYAISPENATKIALYGDMGAGKTTLTKTLLKSLGSLDGGSSPTFTIANLYKMQNNGVIYHLDLYRLNSLNDAFNAGVHEIISSEHMCIVEWPTLIEEWMDDTWLKIYINSIDENARNIKITSSSTLSFDYK